MQKSYLKFLILFLSVFSLTTAFGGYSDRCLRLFDPVFTNKTNLSEVIKDTNDWSKMIRELEKGSVSSDYQPFSIRSQNASESFTPPHDLRSENINVGHTPLRPVPEGGRIITSLTFGYRLPNDFRKIGPLNYLVLDQTGKILEVGVPNKTVRYFFIRHMRGTELSQVELARISELNQKFLSDLRTHPVARQKLVEFAHSRNWPLELIDEGQLAYFDPRIVDPRDWARLNGFSFNELVDAGWLRRDFDSEGKIRYTINSPNSIKIPYLGADGKDSPIWRSRNLEKNRPELPRYTSWQIDRSINRHFKVSERLYNGGKLGSVKGKTIVITEGEFKCLVTEKITGIPMFGIPGITQFDDEIVQALIDAEAAEYIVILDRDPHVNALLRADEVTDSNRAAYTLAKDLERLGAKKVRVGTLPEIIKGEKLGIDDLALKHGSAPIHETIQEALSPEAYAKTIGLDTDFQEVVHRRSRLRKALRNHLARNKRRNLPNEAALIQSADSKVKALDRTFLSYLENELNGARSIDSASGKVNSIQPIAEIPEKATKKILQRDNRELPISAFTSDLLLLDYVPAGVSTLDCRPGLCGQLPFTREDLRAAYEGRGAEGSLQAALLDIDAIAEDTGFTIQSFEDFSLLALASELTHSFPLEKYRFEFGVRLVSNNSGKALPIPLTIVRRESSRAVAIANVYLPSDIGYWSRMGNAFDARLKFLRGYP